MMKQACHHDHDHHFHHHHLLGLPLKCAGPAMANPAPNGQTCLAGVALVSLGSTHSGHNTTTTDTTAMGCVWTILCTVLTAFYCVEWGRKLGDANQMQVGLFLGLMGASNLVFLWPPLLLFGGPGLSWEPGQLLLPQGSAWQLVLANGALSIVANFTLMLGMSFTSPLFSMIGTILQLPLSALADKIWHNQSPAAEEIVGYVCIGVGFLVLVYEQHRPLLPVASTEEDREPGSSGLLGAAGGPSQKKVRRPSIGEDTWPSSCPP